MGHCDSINDPANDAQRLIPRDEAPASCPGAGKSRARRVRQRRRQPVEPFFAGDDISLGAIVRWGTVVKEFESVMAKVLKKGSVIFREGDKSNGTMYFVAQGTLAVAITRAGRPQLVRQLEKGQFFGEMALINSVPRTASVYVDSDAAKVIVIDAATFAKMAKTHPTFLYRLLKTVYSRILEAEVRLDAVKDNVDRSLNFNVFEYVKNVFIRSFRRGDYVFSSGDDSDGMLYSVVSGEVSIMRTLPDGLQLETAVVTEGGVFGEDGILSGEKRKVGAQVKSEHAKIGGLNKETFLRVGSMRPEFFFRLLRLCIERLIFTEANTKS